ncbi:MAG: hypothetical protein QXN55_00865 [Candidatus Nitrosotenuis sp.]
MTYWFKTTGTLIYDPDRGKMKNRTKWWAVVNTCSEISNYYRWWLDKYWWHWEANGYKRRYLQPAWGSHVSVVRGEEPENKEAWGKYHGEKIELEYQHRIEATRELGFRDKFFMVRVRCPRLNEIRKELGLKFEDQRGREFTFHITIAKTEED